MQTKRKLSLSVLGAFVAVAAACLSACSGGAPAPVNSSSAGADDAPLEITPDLIAAAQAEGTLNLQYTMPDDAMQKIADAFTAAYPGIKLELTRNSGAPGGQAVLSDWQAGVSHLDAVAISDYVSAVQVVQAGAIAPLTLPADSARADEFVVGPGMIEIVYQTTVIGINTDLVSPEDAKKLQDWNYLLDPKWKGKINVVSTTTSSGLIPALYGEKYVSPDFLTKLAAQDPVLFDGTAPSRDALVSGQQAIAVGQFDDAMFALLNKGAHVGWVYPNPAPRWGAHAWGVLANAPHPNAARLWWAWVLSKDVGEGIYESQGLSTLTGAPDTRVGATPDADWYAPPVQFWTPSIDEWMNVTPGVREDFDKAFGK